MVSSLGSLTGDQVKCRGEERKEGERRGGDKTEMERKTDEEPCQMGSTCQLRGRKCHSGMLAPQHPSVWRGGVWYSSLSQQV